MATNEKANIIITLTSKNLFEINALEFQLKK